MDLRLKKRWIIIPSILLLFIYLTEKRNFYCLENGKCVTVWCAYANNIYVIPYKYYGLFKPSDNYVITKSPCGIDIFWVNDSIIIRIDKPETPNYKIINKSKIFKMYDYNDDEKYYQDIIFERNGNSFILKKNVNSIGISIDVSIFIDRTVLNGNVI